MKEPYLCLPEKKDGVTKVLCLFLLLFSVASFFLSEKFFSWKAALQLLSVILLLLFIQITTKFLLTQYRYGYENATLFLSARQGKREKNYGSLPVTSACRLLSGAEWKRERKAFHLSQRVSLCQNLFSANACYLLAPDGEKYVLLIFEPDENLLRLLREEIKPKKSDTKDPGGQ